MCCVRKILFLLIGLSVLSFFSNYFYEAIKPIFYYFFYINLASFIIMGVDKQKAIKGLERIPERSFYLLSLIGGFFGVFLGSAAFHHKNRKSYFMALHVAIFALWVLGYFLLKEYLNG